MGTSGDDTNGDDTTGSEVDRWVAEARVDDAVELRRRAAWLRRQADEESTLGATLVDLAERGQPVTLQLANGRRHRGVVVTVGTDALEVVSTIGERVIVAFDALESVRPHGAAMAASEGGPVPTGVTLAALIARRAVRRERVLLVTRRGDATNGEIVTTGRDLVTMALDGGDVVYVSLSAVAEVSGPESG